MFGPRKSFKSKKLKQKRRKIFIFKMLGWFAVFSIVIGFLAWCSYRPAITIKNNAVEGNSVITDKEVLDIVKADISGEYIWIFNKANFLIYPKHSIERELLTKFKRLSGVKISFTDFQSILVSLMS